MTDSMGGAEFVVTTAGEGGGLGRTEHYFKRVLVGDVESTRRRLAYALERLGYRVQSEQPLVAKRDHQTPAWAGKLVAGDVLPHVKRLSIDLKPLTPMTTLATFDYSVMNSAVTKGDRQTLEREAEAMIALGVEQTAESVCPACGTNNTHEARFCRVCGAPNDAGEPAELEVLRLTVGARAAHQNIVGGAVLMLAWAALCIPLYLLSNKTLLQGAVIIGLGELFGFLWILYGMFRLHLTLNPRKNETHLSAAAAPHTLPPANTTTFPLSAVPASATEGTTELLTLRSQRPAPAPLQRKVKDTGAVE